MGKALSRSAKFITFEGIDGCGKTTLMSFLAERLEALGVDFLMTREPGGTPLGENIRNLLLDPSYKTMDQRTEVLLYTASRAQLTQEIIRPALNHGRWVLCDRYIDATLAYQGFGRGLELGPLRQMQEWATQGLWPHHTILLDCERHVAFQRLHCRAESPDRMEQEDSQFHQRVREGYLALAKAEPDRFILIDASRSQEQVLEEFQRVFCRPLLGDDQVENGL